MFKKQTAISFWKKYWEYILALLIPIGIVLLNGILRNSWPFGEYGIMYGDASIQYVPLFEELWNKVHSGDFSFLSWNALGGFDFYKNALYYTVSPTTLIILILPKAWIEAELSLFMVLCWAMLGFSSVYFFMHTSLNKIKKHRRLISLCLGLCFSMSGFVINVMRFFNWLDTLVLFPILLILVERLLKTGKWKSYYIILTAAIFCNFYFAYMVCLFLGLWFLFLLFIRKKTSWVNSAKFVGASMLSGVSSMAVILPCMAGVNERYSTVQGGESVANYLKSVMLSVSGFVQRLFVLNSFGTDTYLTKTIYYVSIGALVLSVFFLFIRTNKKEKYAKLTLFLFVLCSLFIGALNYIWHGFSIPHGIGQRFAFVFELLLLLLTLDVLYNIEQISTKKCMIAMTGELLIFFIVIWNSKEYESLLTYIVTFALLLVYNIILLLFCDRKITKKQLIKVYLILCMVELSANAFYQINYYNTFKADDIENVAEARELTKNLDLKAGERIAFVDTGVNLGLWDSKETLSGFASYCYGNNVNLNYKLGMEVTMDSGIRQSGSTPLLNIIYNTPYGVGMNETRFGDASLLEKGDTLSLYQIDRLAGMGYMVDDTIADWNTSYDTSFDLQNEYVKKALGDESIQIFDTFTPKDLVCNTASAQLEPQITVDKCASCRYVPELDLDGCVMQFRVDKDMDLYLLLRSSEKYRAMITVDSQVVYEVDTEHVRSIIHIGKVLKGQEVRIVIAVPEQTGTEVLNIVQFAAFQDEVYQTVYEELAGSTFCVEKMQGDLVSGVIDADQDGIMATSIPAMAGFDVYVDGQKTDYIQIGNAWIGVPLKKGKHTVTFEYETPYAKCGWMITLCGILGSAAWMILESIYNKQKRFLKGENEDASFFC